MTEAYMFVVAFLIMGSLILGSMLGWVLREYMMYHHDRQYNQAPMHPEMYDLKGNVIPDEIIAFRFENLNFDSEIDDEL